MLDCSSPGILSIKDQRPLCYACVRLSYCCISLRVLNKKVETSPQSAGAFRGGLFPPLTSRLEDAIDEIPSKLASLEMSLLKLPFFFFFARRITCSTDLYGSVHRPLSERVLPSLNAGTEEGPASFISLDDRRYGIFIPYASDGHIGLLPLRSRMMSELS